MNEVAEQIEEEVIVDQVDVEPQPDNPTLVDNESAESPEDQARRMGWKPEEDYKGPDGKWVTAETFLENTENDPAQLRRSLRTIERNYSKLEKGMDALISHQDREVERVKEESYKKAQTENETKFRQAIEDGDEETVTQMYREKNAPQSQDGQPLVQKWASKPENAWLKTDDEMNKVANRYADRLAADGVPVQEMLDKTDTYMRERYPEAFPHARRAPRPVNAGNRNGVVVKQQVQPGSYEALNQEGKASCDSLVRTMSAKGVSVEKTRANFLEYATEDMFK